MPVSSGRCGAAAGSVARPGAASAGVGSDGSSAGVFAVNQVAPRPWSEYFLGAVSGPEVAIRPIGSSGKLVMVCTDGRSPGAGGVSSTGGAPAGDLGPEAAAAGCCVSGR